MQKTSLFIMLCLSAFANAVAQNRQEVKVLQWSLIDEGDYIKILGEVENTYSSYLGEVKIEIEYFDKNGKSIGVDRFTARDAGTKATDETYASLDVIAPGQTAPFERTRDKKKLNGTVENCKLIATGRLFSREPSVSAEIENLEVTPIGNGFQVSGTYKVTGTQACRYPGIVLAGYNESGKIVRIKNISLSSTENRYKTIKSLDTGKEHRFSGKIYNPASGKITKVKAFAYFDL